MPDDIPRGTRYEPYGHALATLLAGSVFGVVGTLVWAWLAKGLHWVVACG